MIGATSTQQPFTIVMKKKKLSPKEQKSRYKRDTMSQSQRKYYPIQTSTLLLKSIKTSIKKVKSVISSTKKAVVVANRYKEIILTNP